MCIRDRIKVLENSIKKSELEIFFNTNKLTHFQNQLLSIIKSNDSVTSIGQKLYSMFDSLNENDQFTQLSQKQSLNHQDIQEIIKLKQDKPNEVNDEILRQGKWMTKKLYLIKETSKKLKQIREDNINNILYQNTKLIEECNLLRAENEKYRKEIKEIEKLLASAMRKRQKLRNQEDQQKLQIQQKSSPIQLNKLMKKYETNEEKLQQQKKQLENIQEQVQDMIGIKQSSENTEKLPLINQKELEQKISDLNSNEQNEQQDEQQNQENNMK
eukprot:TRINITY_DN2700_c0_g1_i1.p1 TRINITY_DN2700_c0_g1~~TRINITY_DN2700_c0_g1_i1.p1  ORF type:complete len:271 (-),score=65.92 TRINITY_DN2700_c0_g1_i1:114-926(-)